MKKSISLKVTAFVTVFAMMLTGCAGSTPATTPPTTTPPVTAEESVPEEPTTVEITDIYGTVTVPIKPKTVVALDNRTFQTLEDWGIELAAAPKPVMPAGLAYKTDDSIQDVGSHNEPNLEVIAAVDPDLVIVGQRFASRYEDIKALVPNATVINLNFDVSVDADSPGDNFVNGFKNSTFALGQIFDKNAEAEKLVADFEAAIAEVEAAYDPSATIMTLVTSGGNIRFSAPMAGRVWGPMYEIFGWTSSLYVDGASSDHQGDDISIEAIAQSNPDWIFVLDRDAMNTSADGFVPAYDLIAASPALGNITAVTQNQMVFAPNDTYTNESIQTYIKLFSDIADALSK